MRLTRLVAVAAIVAVLTPAQETNAATDSGCWRVINVVPGDSLNMRARPDFRSQIVDRLIPGRHGIISADGRCIPNWKPWGQRWCPISHSSGHYPTTRGWAKARFLGGAGCP